MPLASPSSSDSRVHGGSFDASKAKISAYEAPRLTRFGSYCPRDNVESAKLCIVSNSLIAASGSRGDTRRGEAFMDRFELGFAVTAMTGFVVLIAASVWLMVLPI